MQKEKSRQVVKQLLTACIANMFLALHWVTVIYINIFFFSSNFPVRWAICSEVWNCSKQGFTVCLHSVSARGEQIFLIAQAGLLSFRWCKVEIRILFLSFFSATLLYADQQYLGVMKRCSFCYQVVLLIRFAVLLSVSESINSCLLNSLFVMFCFLFLVSFRLSHHFLIFTAMISCAVSHWWVMTVEFGKIVLD